MQKNKNVELTNMHKKKKKETLGEPFSDKSIAKSN